MPGRTSQAERPVPTRHPQYPVPTRPGCPVTGRHGSPSQGCLEVGEGLWIQPLGKEGPGPLDKLDGSPFSLWSRPRLSQAASRRCLRHGPRVPLLPASPALPVLDVGTLRTEMPCQAAHSSHLYRTCNFQTCQRHNSTNYAFDQIVFFTCNKSSL